MSWTEERIEKLTKMWEGGATASQIAEELGGVSRNGDAAHCVPGALNLAFAGVDGEALMLAMKDLAVSSGSACTSASIEPSYVLRGIGLDDATAHASLRFSLGRFSTAAEVEFAIGIIGATLERLRDAVAPGRL